MTPDQLRARFAGLTTAHMADACLRARIPVRCGPAALRPVTPGMRLAGRVLPARHVGSVDIFLEACDNAVAGDVLVVDNSGRQDEACVGDLVVLEAAGAGVGGVVVWGLHRDTADICEIGLPVFSVGAIPTGPQRLDERPADAPDAAVVGEWTVTSDDIVLGDDDGVLFVPGSELDGLLGLAEQLRDTERAQAGRIRDGESLRRQLDFDGFLRRRRVDPGWTLRQHLRAVGGAIEE